MPAHNRKIPQNLTPLGPVLQEQPKQPTAEQPQQRQQPEVNISETGTLKITTGGRDYVVNKAGFTPRPDSRETSPRDSGGVVLPPIPNNTRLTVPGTNGQRLTTPQTCNSSSSSSALMGSPNGGTPIVEPATSPTALEPELLGTKIQWKDLQIGHIIGQGMQAKVRKVKYQRTLYALKIIRLDDKVTKKQLQGELEHLLMASHPNVVHSLNAFFVDGDLKILMEYMDAGTLVDLVKTGPLPEHILSCISAQILSGLKSLHKANILHRDIKPSNILVNSLGFVKVSDFGLSKVINQVCPVTITGTTAYMSPERVRADTFTTIEDTLKSDVWSVGLTIAYCALGVFPFYLETPANTNPFTAQLNMFLLSTLLADGQAEIDFVTVVQMIQRYYPDRRPPTVTENVIDFIKLCMRQNVRERPSCAELESHPLITQYKGKVNLKNWLIENGLIQPRRTPVTTSPPPPHFPTANTATTNNGAVSPLGFTPSSSTVASPTNNRGGVMDEVIHVPLNISSLSLSSAGSAGSIQTTSPTTTNSRV